MSEFGNRVKEIMKEKNLSQKEVSELSGVSEASLCRYLRGMTEPRIDIAQNVARALGVSASYLLGTSDKYTPADDKTEIKKILARNRKILTPKEKSEIVAILYGEDDER